MAFDEADCRKVFTGVRPRTFDREALPDGIRRGDTLALPVARTTDAANDCVDFVAGGFCVLEAFEQECCRAFAHHEAVGSLVVRARASGRKRPDFAEFREARRAHVAVDTAGQHRVIVALFESADRCADRCHRRGASRIGGEVWPVEVEHRSHASRDDVREFPGHRVFGDIRKVVAHSLHGLVDDRAPHRFRQRLKTRRPSELSRELGEEDAKRGLVVLVASHRVSENHGGAVTVESPIGVAVVEESFAARHDRPFLRPVHRLGDLRWNRKLPLERLPAIVAHPSANFRISLVDRLGVRVVVESRIPALRRSLGNAVATFGDVGPKRLGVRRIWEHGPDPDDSNGSMYLVWHVPIPLRLRPLVQCVSDDIHVRNQPGLGRVHK